MTSSQINAYMSTMSANSASSTSNTNSSNASIKTTDFLSMLAKQMSCQDPMNPTDNTQYLSELAQFSSLQMSENQLSNSQSQLETIQTLMGLQYLQFGSALVGKTVVVESTDSSGQTQKVQGAVSSVDFTTDVYTINIDGKSYPISSVKQVISNSK